MNAQERYEKFILGEEQKKVELKIDTKIPNAATIIVEKEDHTLGNIVRMQLMRDEHVEFVGYMVEHPLEHRVLFKVKASTVKSPLSCFTDALENLKEELQAIQMQFENKLAQFEADN